MKVGDLTRNLKNWDEFKKSAGGYNEGGDRARIVATKQGENPHPGANEIKAQDVYVKHDANVYKAFGIQHNEEMADANHRTNAGVSTYEQVNESNCSDDEEIKEDYSGSEDDNLLGEEIQDLNIDDDLEESNEYTRTNVLSFDSFSK